MTRDQRGLLHQIVVLAGWGMTWLAVVGMVFTMPWATLSLLFFSWYTEYHLLLTMFFCGMVARYVSSRYE